MEWSMPGGLFTHTVEVFPDKVLFVTCRVSQADLMMKEYMFTGVQINGDAMLHAFWDEIASLVGDEIVHGGEGDFSPPTLNRSMTLTDEIKLTGGWHYSGRFATSIYIPPPGPEMWFSDGGGI